MEGQQNSPGLCISAVNVANGTVAQLFHFCIGPQNSNSPHYVANVTKFFDVCQSMSEHMPRFAYTNFRTLLAQYLIIEHH